MHCSIYVCLHYASADHWNARLAHKWAREYSCEQKGLYLVERMYVCVWNGYKGMPRWWMQRDAAESTWGRATQQQQHPPRSEENAHPETESTGTYVCQPPSRTVNSSKSINCQFFNLFLLSQRVSFSNMSSIMETVISLDNTCEREREWNAKHSLEHINISTTDCFINWQEGDKSVRA